MDYFRKPAAKDISGWFGPATVADLSHASRGIISIRHSGRLMECRVQDVRRHLHFLVYLMGEARQLNPSGQVHVNAWEYIKAEVERTPRGTVVLLGMVKQGAKWVNSSNNRKFPGLMSAIKFYAENQLHLANVISARIGLCVRHLPKAIGYAKSVTVLWRPAGNYVRYIEAESTEDEIIERFQIGNEYSDWEHLRLLQVLSTLDAAAIADTEAAENEGVDGVVQQQHTSTTESRLSPIALAHGKRVFSRTRASKNATLFSERNVFWRTLCLETTRDKNAASRRAFL